MMSQGGFGNSGIEVATLRLFTLKSLLHQLTYKYNCRGRGSVTVTVTLKLITTVRDDGVSGSYTATTLARSPRARPASVVQLDLPHVPQVVATQLAARAHEEPARQNGHPPDPVEREGERHEAGEHPVQEGDGRHEVPALLGHRHNVEDEDRSARDKRDDEGEEGDCGRGRAGGERRAASDE